jgi:hypothetical protein
MRSLRPTLNPRDACRKNDRCVNPGRQRHDDLADRRCRRKRIERPVEQRPTTALNQCLRLRGTKTLAATGGNDERNDSHHLATSC